MPLAFEFRVWLVDDVLPSIEKTGAYISPGITDPQINELQKKVKLLEERELQQRKNKIHRNQIYNLMPIEEIYILTTREYNKDYLYKIGKSTRISKRLKTLNTSRLKDNEMYMCYIAKIHDANTVEFYPQLPFKTPL